MRLVAGQQWSGAQANMNQRGIVGWLVAAEQHNRTQKLWLVGILPLQRCHMRPRRVSIVALLATASYRLVVVDYRNYITQFV